MARTKFEVFKEKGMTLEEMVKSVGVNDYTSVKTLMKRLNQPVEVLDEVEKAYLTAVIKPLHLSRVRVTKLYLGGGIRIKISYSTSIGRNDIMLPYFDPTKPDNMYVGMEPNHAYTLRSLGLAELDSAYR